MTREPAGESATLEYGTGARAASKRGKGFLAAAGSLALPGLGQVMAGAWRRGLGWFGAAAVGMGVMVHGVMGLSGGVLWSLVVLVPVAGLMPWASAVDAYRTGRRRGGWMLGRPWLRYVMGVAILAAGVWAAPFEQLAVGVVRPYWAETFLVSARSMEPTLRVGDVGIAAKRVGSWRRWDVVMFTPPDGLGAGLKFCKRIVGLPGERVEIRAGVVYINGAAVAAPEGMGLYVEPPGSTDLRAAEGRPVWLGEGEYFVLGDNAAMSADSRHWSTAVREADLDGRVTAIYWPVSRWRVFD